MSTALASAPLLDQPFALSVETVAAYRRDGHAHVSGLLDAATIAAYAPAITTQVTQRAGALPPLAERSTYGKAFIQIGNLWRQDPHVRTFIFARRLAQVAAELMGCRGVRMYHDQALDKEPGGGFTPWHADQQYWPLATDRCITAWIPLQEVPADMGPLEFADGSQRILAGRDLAISDDSERQLGLTLRDCPKTVRPYRLGDVSFHSGWTFHRAGPNRTDRCRRVMTIIYMDVDMRLKEPENPNQANDRRSCCPGVEVGEIIDSPINPVIWAQAPAQTPGR